jgi:hypothetical protein
MTKRLSKKQVERVIMLTDLVADQTVEAQRLQGELVTYRARIEACERAAWDARAEIKTILQERLAAPVDAPEPVEQGGGAA